MQKKGDKQDAERTVGEQQEETFFKPAAQKSVQHGALLFITLGNHEDISVLKNHGYADFPARIGRIPAAETFVLMQQVRSELARTIRIGGVPQQLSVLSIQRIVQGFSVFCRKRKTVQCCRADAASQFFSLKEQNVASQVITCAVGMNDGKHDGGDKDGGQRR